MRSCVLHPAIKLAAVARGKQKAAIAAAWSRVRAMFKKWAPAGLSAESRFFLPAEVKENPNPPISQSDCNLSLGFEQHDRNPNSRYLHERSKYGDLA
jgi:hypothetical protein